jgi:phosphoribosyl 1,2-cyclic phosphodiesterase
MKLTFLGTRGYIDSRTKLHYMHTSLKVAYRGKEVIIDCGEDWLERIDEMNPKALVITHAHPDHVGGLKQGAPCPVYATKETWEVIQDYDIKDRRVIFPRKPFTVKGIVFDAFKVAHSTRAPAVGFRIMAGNATIFYAPDLVYIQDRKHALSGVKMYVGDGSTITRSMVRKPGRELIGHTTLGTQLTWCRREGVPKVIFTHCGSEIVEGNGNTVRAKIRSLAKDRNMEAEIACDGREIILK